MSLEIPPELASASRATEPQVDRQGRSIALWKTSEGNFIGAISSPEGRVQFISGAQIIQSSNRSPCPTALLDRVSTSPANQWKFLFSEQSGVLVLFPRLIAAA